MTSNIPAYSTYFPSAWTVEDGDDSNKSLPSTPVPNINATVKSSSSSSSPSSSPSPSPSPSLSLSPMSPTQTEPTQTPSKYLTHFPPSWVLPPSSTRTSSLRPVDFPRTFSTSTNSTLRPQSTIGLVPRSATAFNLGPQIALWKQLNQGQSFPIPKDEDYLDNFRKTLHERLMQSTVRKGLGMKGREWANKSWYAGMPQVPGLTPLQKTHNLGAINGDQMDEEDHDYEATGTEDEDDAFYGTGDGDVLYQAPPVAVAYSTRGSASVVSY
jgi:hypothetical protein